MIKRDLFSVLAFHKSGAAVIGCTVQYHPRKRLLYGQGKLQTELNIEIHAWCNGSKKTASSHVLNRRRTGLGTQKKPSSYAHVYRVQCD